ncbi:UDP-2,4-diacetamido-2,4,6-trideoxy-beta-L-altropyranose hydrolase [Candidatus Thioglobus sp.]|nr:UDP-2,4-diacetamido-2,4,6-trideoxy-beta-L-altropyranose hydrolase [Candidatus Thioglobus sp.]
MRIIIRATASKKMGSGHIMRCITLAEELSKKNDNIIEFVTQKYPENLDDLIKKKGFIVHSIDASISRNEEGIVSEIFEQEKDAYDTINAIKSQKIDWVIIDHYSIDYNWQEKLRPYTKKIMAIDDLANRKHNCDILLDQNYSSNEMRYENFVKSDTVKLLGPRFALLRKEFYELRKKRKKIISKVKRVFIFFGGSDSDNLTSKSIKIFSKPDLSYLDLDVVIGSINPHKKEVSALVAAHSNAKLHIQVDNIAELMSDADIALCAGGSSTWERMSVGLPSIVVTIADNQDKLSNDLDKDGYINWLGRINKVNFMMIEDALRHVILNPQQLELQSQKCKSLVDSLGSKRVSNLLLGDIKAKELQLREANRKDCQLYWYWVNDPLVRENAYHQHNITIEEHQIWFRKQLNNPNVIMLVVESEFGPAGQVRFDYTNSNCIISYSIAKQFRGFGLGKTIINKAISYLPHKQTFTIIAKVRESNIPSRKIFENIGFLEVGKPHKSNQYMYTYHFQISPHRLH